MKKRKIDILNDIPIKEDAKISKKCPILKGRCTYEKCEFWLEGTGTCVFIQQHIELDNLNKLLESLLKRKQKSLRG